MFPAGDSFQVCFIIPSKDSQFHLFHSCIKKEQIEGEKVEAVTDFLFLGSKITANDDCSHEINRCVLLGRKAVTYLDSILRSRDITLPTKVRSVKAMVFPVVMRELDHKEG